MQNLNHPGAADGSPSMLQEATIGIIGLGRMGQAFGGLLLSSGAHSIAYDRDSDRVEALARRGATSASGVRDFAPCEVILTSLPDDDAVRAVVLSESGLASVLRPGSIHLSTGTIGVAFCRELDAAHRKLGQSLVAMPVLGNPDMAAKRELSSGWPSASDRALPSYRRTPRATELSRRRPALACER
jgi:3-hydroxyisobutyrate dehydrogenase-like beta-hydroxyacid dehydrogenase